MLSIKNNVDPEELQRWFAENPEVVYGRSLETAKSLVCDEEADQGILLEFYWCEKLYSKIFMSKKDIPIAMEKALNYFVRNEEYEKAQIAKDIIDSYKEQYEVES
jgi:hypothetical protein